ncbi:MAG: prepilin-type N-terminal cleavage/methylation domain-containing protein [Campylobacter sp.]|uniref:pilus assembly FimT family protein n=1 Tax=Campylobacter sp. TaxID=205 RepID=UPI0029779735|nr:prepilin-type N-terminal cleavage/methylation domain-containing protein [Campylobacter sp.]MDD7600570.1 prepilin-type N-terminal cleavage/methylation domain-containing protein [Campylobacteraceae bacterium]MDY5887907.1 prepilin-type N-terminal cleavage/methylation domain-containing protein [Campylobacter sp.]
MKKAFTLVELIFVMVVLAIVAAIGTDILRSLFDNYAVTAQIHRLESVANNAADTIATRLEKRVAQTTAIETILPKGDGTKGKKYQPLSAMTRADANNDKLVFFRKAYELERNFISAKNGGVSAPRTSGFISELKTTTTTGDGGKFVDTVEFVSKETNLTGLNLNDYELFFSNDSSLLYENKGDHFDRYYSGNKSFAYQCDGGNIEFKEGKFTLVRSNCPASTSTIVRPSMAALVHKFSLSKEIDKIYLEDNNLYLETCDIKGDCKKSLLATGVSTFRFSALGSDPNIANTIVFKLCLKEDDGEAELCQSRIVR